MGGGLFELLPRHGGHALGHAKVQVIDERERRSGAQGEPLEQPVDEARVFEAGIHPLGDQAQQGTGVLCRGSEHVEEGPDAIQLTDAFLDAPMSQQVPQLGE